MENKMNKTVLLFVILAAICLVLGLIDTFIEAKLFVRSYTWHQLAQTFLLFGIAWGVGHKFLTEKKED